MVHRPEIQTATMPAILPPIPEPSAGFANAPLDSSDGFGPPGRRQIFPIPCRPRKNDRFANQDSIGAFANAPYQFQGCRPDFQNGASSGNPNSNHACNIATNLGTVGGVRERPVRFLRWLWSAWPPSDFSDPVPATKKRSLRESGFYRGVRESPPPISRMPARFSKWCIVQKSKQQPCLQYCR